MALKLDEVKAESSWRRVGDEMSGDQIERTIASHKHAHTHTHIHIHTHTQFGISVGSLKLCLCLSVYVSVFILYILLKVGRLGEGTKRPRQRANKGECSL